MIGPVSAEDRDEGECEYHPPCLPSFSCTVDGQGPRAKGLGLFQTVS